ncbi:hypothetical protein B0T09DRAFT_329618 [Sordaria sp. MPI-SDFR-AT-0083]|nr:hypothetical protein B0T09DRAFT_329618 [Sordaria sp. MPI-SDFR-AT-0083]
MNFSSLSCILTACCTHHHPPNVVAASFASLPLFRTKGLTFPVVHYGSRVRPSAVSDCDQLIDSVARRSTRFEERLFRPETIQTPDRPERKLEKFGGGKKVHEGRKEMGNAFKRKCMHALMWWICGWFLVVQSRDAASGTCSSVDDDGRDSAIVDWMVLYAIPYEEDQ